MNRRCSISGPLGIESHSRPMGRFSIGRFAVRTRIDCPEQRAAMHLKRIVALTEARQACDDTYFLKAGGKRFLLNDRAVALFRMAAPNRPAFLFPLTRICRDRRL